MKFLKFARENADEDLYHLIRIFAGTGRRRNEIIFLEREDVDLEKGIYRPRNEKRRLKPKICRTIPQDVFDSFEHFINKYPKSQYSFKFCHENSVTHWVKDLLIKTGHPELNLHSLRHTYITLLHEKGYTMRQIQNVIDHSNILVTELYSHDEMVETPSVGIEI